MRTATDMARRHARSGLAPALALLLTLGPPAATRGDNPVAAILEPVVTPRESELLDQTLQQAQTDRPAALKRLTAAEGPTASAALAYVRGNLLAQDNRLEDAIAAYEDALQKLPRYRAARANLARVHLLRNRPDDARAALQPLLDDGLLDADTCLLLGHAFGLTNRPVPAESAYRQALLHRPDDLEARRGLAKALLDQSRHAEAAALVNDLLRDLPTDAALWSLTINLAVMRGDSAAAIVAAETARCLAAATPDTLALLGDLYLTRQQPADAVAAYRAARDAGPLPADRRLRLAEGLLALDARADARELLTDLRAAVTDAHQDFTRAQRSQLLRLEATLARLEDRPADARALLDKLVRENPLDGEAMLALGELIRGAGQPDEALVLFERAGRLQGFEARALVRQAETEVGRGHYARATELLETAQAIDPQPPVARYLARVRVLVPAP